MQADRMLTTKQIAARFNCSTKTIYRWFRAKKLPDACQPGGPKSEIRMPEKSLVKMLKGQTG